jgi:hypothetical protein
MHRYNKKEHLIFKYHYKESAKRDQLNQNKSAKPKRNSVKQHLSPKEREKQEWNEWFYSVKCEDGKQANPNQDPDAHIIEKPPSSASLFQLFMEENYNKFFFDLIRGIHPYEEEDDASEDGITKVTVIPEDLFATCAAYN